MIEEYKLSLRDVLIKAYNLVLDGDFDRAIDYYYVIDKKIRIEELTPDLEEAYSIYDHVMLLYLSLNEAAVLSKQGKMDLLKDKLDSIYYMKKELIPKVNSQKLINYMENSYHYILGWYMYNFYKERFLKEYETVYYYMKAGWIDKAINHYNTHLLKYYNKVSKYGDYNARSLIYNAIINLNREIKLTSLKEQAYSEIAGYTFSSIQREPVKEKIISSPREIKKIETVKFNNKEFKKLHKLIEENKIEEAAGLYNKLI